MAKYVSIVERAEPVLEAGDAVALGKLVDENHALCQELTVSCPELDNLVIAAREAGAVGAKMSGTGRGGLMLAITPGDALQVCTELYVPYCMYGCMCYMYRVSFTLHFIFRRLSQKH